MAWREQVPAARMVTTPPAVHTAGVVEAKLTDRPEEALPETANGGVPKGTAGKAANAMLWAAGDTVKLWTTGAAEA